MERRIDATYTKRILFEANNIYVSNTPTQASGSQKMRQVAIKVNTDRLAETVEQVTYIGLRLIRIWGCPDINLGYSNTHVFIGISARIGRKACS